MDKQDYQTAKPVDHDDYTPSFLIALHRQGVALPDGAAAVLIAEIERLRREVTLIDHFRQQAMHWQARCEELDPPSNYANSDAT